MGRIYSMFPPGWPGLALLLLRVSAMLTSIVSLAERNHTQPNWELLALTPLGAALCAGFLTPLAALIAITVQLLRFLPSTSDLLCLSVIILNTSALAILGPGAYSVDALLFGRRLLLTNRDD